MSKPIDESEIDRAARTIIQAYGAAAAHHAMELEFASRNAFAQAVRKRVEELLKS